MIKVSVMYPYAANTAFDHAYYRDTHMPLVKTLLEDGCSFYTVDKGLAGGDPGSVPSYVAMCHIFSPSAALFQAGMERHGAEILGDIANFTTIQPVVQLSEVVVGYPGSAIDRAARVHPDLDLAPASKFSKRSAV